jgi:hypothetical protein
MLVEGVTMTKDAQINIRVSDEQKQQWKEYAREADEVTGLPDLMQLAMARYMNDSGGESIDVQQVELDADVEERLRAIETQLDEMDDTLGTVYNEVTSTSGDLSDELFEALPESEDDAVDVGTLTERVEGDYGRVKDTLLHLADQSRRVRYRHDREGGREQYYVWKEV